MADPTGYRHLVGRLVYLIVTHLFYIFPLYKGFVHFALYTCIGVWPPVNTSYLFSSSSNMLEHSVQAWEKVIREEKHKKKMCYLIGGAYHQERRVRSKAPAQTPTQTARCPPWGKLAATSDCTGVQESGRKFVVHIAALIRKGALIVTNLIILLKLCVEHLVYA